MGRFEPFPTLSVDDRYVRIWDVGRCLVST
jgi:hypothetical protein